MRRLAALSAVLLAMTAGCEDGPPPPPGTVAEPSDRDGDGWVDALDCEPDDPAFHPEAPEQCDGVDGNCDGVVPSSELDRDEDGVRVCAGDCDDESRWVRPGAEELCDGRDNDCDGELGEDERDGAATDDDGDLSSECAGDCDDADPTVHPGVPEPCGGPDMNCDGRGPDFDDDGDGFGPCSGHSRVAIPPTRYHSGVQVPSDEELLTHVEAMAAGDVEGLVAFHAAAGPWVYGAIVHIVGRGVTGEQLLEQVFVGLWQEAPHYDRHFGRPLMWAMAAAREAAVRFIGGDRRVSMPDHEIASGHPLALLSDEDRAAVIACWRNDVPRPDRGPDALRDLVAAGPPPKGRGADE